MGLTMAVPDLGTLDLFVETVRRGSISQAARAASISQPAASMKLRQLERRLGLPLLDRHVTGCTPTQAGRVLFDHGCQLLAEAGALTQALDDLRGHAGGHLLRIASSYTIAEYVLPRTVPDVCRAIPGVEMGIKVFPSRTVVQLVRDGDADLGFIESLDVPPGLESTVILRDHLVLVVGPGHPWARRFEPVTATDVASTALVMRAAGAGTLGQALKVLGLRLAPPLVEVGSTSAVKSAIAQGVAPGVVSVLSVREEVRRGDLIPVQVADLQVRRELRAIWRPGHASQVSSKIVQMLVEDARDLDMSTLDTPLVASVV